MYEVLAMFLNHHIYATNILKVSKQHIYRQERLDVTLYMW